MAPRFLAWGPRVSGGCSFRSRYGGDRNRVNRGLEVESRGQSGEQGL